MSKRKVIVFAPHPDDETWGCGGIIAKRVSDGYEVFIVILTDGRHAFSSGLGIYSDPTPEELIEIRSEEAKRAVRILGVREENLFFLGFEDGMLEKNEGGVQEKVEEILGANPFPIEVYFPYEKDYHIDHRVTNRVVRKAIKKLGLRTIKCQYSISQRYGRIGPLIDVFLNIFRHNMIRVDISEFLSLKESAAREFKSGISIISSQQRKPLVKGIDKFLKRREIFYIDR